MKNRLSICLLALLLLCVVSVTAQDLRISVGSLPNSSSVCGPTGTFTVAVTNPDTATITVTNVNVDLATAAGVNVLAVTGDGILLPGNQVNVGNLAPGQTATFTAEYQLSCAATSTTFNFVATATSDGGRTGSAPSTTSERTFADISIPTASSPAVFNAFLGKEETVSVNVVNNGFGAVETINYCVSNNLQALALNGLTVAGIDVGTTPDFTLGNQQCFTITLPAPFSRGQTIVAEETWEVVQCVNDPLDIQRRAQYGCQGDNDCQDKPQGDYRTTAVTFDNLFPNLNVSTTARNRPACYLDEPTTATVRIINDGTAPAQDPGFRIETANGNGMVIDLNSVVITNEQTGATITTFSTANLRTGSSCQGNGLTRIDYRLTGLVLDIGESFVVNYSVNGLCACNDCDIRDKYFSRVQLRDYEDLCGNLQSDRGSTTPSGRYNAYLGGLAEGPANLNDGDQGQVSYFVTDMELDWMTSEFPNAFLEVIVDIPCALDYVAGSFTWKDRANIPYPVGSLTYVDNNTVGSTDQLIARFNAADLPGGFAMTDGANFDFSVEADCDEKDLADCATLVATQTIATRFELTTDPSCTADCTPQKVWGPDDLEVRIRCTNPGLCEGACDGIDFQNFRVFRTNLGLADADNNQVPDGAATADPATAQTDRYLRGDSLRAVLTGRVQDADNNQNFDFGFVEFPLEHGDFTPLGASIVITDATDGTTYVCSAVPLAPDGPNQQIVVDFSVSRLTAFGCGLPAGFTFDDGDQLVVTLDFTEKNELPGGTDFLIRDYEPRFYVSANGMMTAGGQCNPLNARMTQIGFSTNRNLPDGDFGACDQPNWNIRYERYLGGPALDEFANEIRSFALPDRLVFTKPAEFTYRLDNWGITLRQLIDPANNIVSTNNISSQYLILNGDEVTFLIGDFLKSLGNLEVPPDEGYRVDIRPRIQGNCASRVDEYSYRYQLFEEVDENIFCQPEIARPQVQRTFDYTGAAVLLVESVEDNIVLCSGNEDARVRVRNVSTANAVNAFFYPEPTGQVIVNRVERTNGTEILPNAFGIYPLGTVNANSFQELTIFFTKNTCANAFIDFVAGWDCEGLPETINDATCSDPSRVALTSANSNVDLLVTQPDRNSTQVIDLCEPVPFAADILSTDLGFVRDMILTFSLPPNVFYEPGTFEIAVPLGTPPNVTSTYVNPGVEPTDLGGNIYRIDVSSLDEVLDTEGLVGSKEPSKSVVSIRFNATTECGYLSGERSTFTIESRNSCGDPLPPVVRETGRLRTSDREQDISIVVQPVEVVFNACATEAQTLNVTTMIGGADVSNVDSIRVLLPIGVSYVPDSYVPLQNANPGNNPTVIRDVGGREALLFPLTPPSNGENTIRFDIDIIATDVGQSCQAYPLTVDAFAAVEDSCNGVSCQITESRGEATSLVQIQKPDLEFTALDGGITLNPADGTATASFSATVVNNGFLLTAGNSVTVAIFEDANGNGSYDADTDIFLFELEQVLATDLGPGQMTMINGTATFAAANICTVIAVLDPNRTCTCTTRPSATFRPDITYDFQRDYEVCSGDQLQLGPATVAGYAYQWISVEGSDLTNLDPADDSPTTFTAPANNTGAPITVQYDLRVSNAPCFTDERVSITIAPALNEAVDVQACAGETYTLPTTTAAGAANFNWQPATGLTFTDGGRTATVAAVPPGMTVYTLTYEVGDGCAATYTVNLNGLDCGPVEAAVGDTVWFDFDEDGFQDPDEPGIGGVTVYLINANNGSIISTTMTAADGSYLFDGLPAGNYAVQFVLPDGFVFTLNDAGGDDTNDSDPDPLTGITPPMFVPLDSADLNFDAGFIPDCRLELELTTGPCLPSGDTLARRLQLVAEWENNPYTYDQFGDGNDTLDVMINGVDYTLVVGDLSGTATIFDSLVSPDMVTTYTAAGSFRQSSRCIATDIAPPLSPCIYDLALTKTASTRVPTPGPYTFGDVVCVDITVFNQGEQAVRNVQVFDSLPAGLAYVTTGSTLGWANISPLQLFTFAGPILPGDMAVATLCAEVAATAGGTDNYVNRAEINSFSDTLGNDLSDFDVDSQPDNNFTNDPGGEPGGATDDLTNGNPNDPALPNDEDDSDPFLLPVFDLALRKTLAPAAEQPTGRTSGFRFGEQVAFVVTVINQGNQDGFAVSVRDSISAGLNLVSATVPVTTRGGNAIAETTALAGGGTTGTFTFDQLAAGDTVDVIVIAELTVATLPPIINFAEISAADDDQNPGNGGATDVDSTPDDNFGNDPGGVIGGNSDDATGGNGTGAPGSDNAATDEDDADGAQVPTYDLALIKALDAGSVNPTGSYPPGTEVTFNINVCNQGSDPVTNVTIIDYLPCGLDYLPANALNQAQGWTQTSPFATTPANQLDSVFVTITDVITPGTCRQLQIRLARASTMVPLRCPNPLPMSFLTNVAEIRQFEDLTGNVQNDLDSTPDGNPDNDPGGMVNMESDNQLNGNGTGTIPSNDPLTDEDDADPANLDAFDLAIYKVIDSTTTPPPYLFGSVVKFDLGIVSQGNIAAQAVSISDLLPVGLSYDPNFGNNATAGDGSGWQGTGPAPSLIITDFTGLVNNDAASDTLGFRDTATVSIWLRVEPTAALLDADYTNLAQIETGTFNNPMTGEPVLVTADGDSPYGLGVGNDTGGGVGTDDDNQTLDDAPGEDIDSQDPAFVMVSALSLGSTVFLDINNDGLQNGLDSGLAAVEVQLFSVATGMQVLTDSDGQPVNDPALANPLFTDGAGNYLFSNLPPGDYYVVIPTPPTGAPTSSNNSGLPFVETDPDDDEDGDDDGLQAGGGQSTTSDTITLAVMNEPSGTEEDGPGGDQDDDLPLMDNNGNMTLDFGFFLPVSVGDTAFVDLDGNGLQDLGEPGIGGLTVTLLDSNGDTVTIDADGSMITGITMTDPNGSYLFDNLPPGAYSVVFDISTADNAEFYAFTIPNAGDDADDSDNSIALSDSTAQSEATDFLNSGEQDLTLDVGVRCDLTVTVAEPFTVCSTQPIDLTAGATVVPDTTAIFGATWMTPDGTGDFVDTEGNVLTEPYRFGTAIGYLTSAADAERGSVTLILTTDDPAGPCEPVRASVTIEILKVDCGQFPWGGDD